VTDDALRARALQLVQIAAERPRRWRKRAAALLAASATLALIVCALK